MASVCSGQVAEEKIHHGWFPFSDKHCLYNKSRVFKILSNLTRRRLLPILAITQYILKGGTRDTGLLLSLLFSFLMTPGGRGALGPQDTLPPLLSQPRPASPAGSHE